MVNYKKPTPNRRPYKKKKICRRKNIFYKDNFYFYRKLKSFVADGRVVRGIRPFIEKNIAPIKPLAFPLYSGKYTDERGDDNTVSKRTWPVKTKDGLTHGIAIHRQLKHAIDKGEKAKPRSILVRSIIFKLKSMGLRPVAAEAPVWSHRMRMGSQIDVVCLDGDGRVVLIELKTGNKFDFFKYNQLMQPPFQSIGHSLLHLASLQLLTGYLLFKETHPLMNVQSAYVVHATYHGVWAYQIPGSVLKHTGELQNLIAKT